MFRPAACTLFNTASRRTFSSTSRAQDVAKLTLCGHVATPPETVDTPAGGSFLKYTVATGFGSREMRRTSFWRVAVFDERQKEIVSSLSKGSLVHVDADIELKLIPDESGKNHSYINLYQRSINVLIRKGAGAPSEDGMEEAAEA